MNKERAPELDQHRAVWLTKEAYELLREQKKAQGKSMAQITNNVIIEKYGEDRF